MKKPFTKILVPVVFNRNTRWSVDKALQLANKFDCDIILLYVQPPPVIFMALYDALGSGSFTRRSVENAQLKMRQLEQYAKSKLNDGLLVLSAIMEGYWQTILKNVVIAEHIDLVIIPRNRKRINRALIRRVNVNKLCEQTNCPVLTVTRAFNANHLQNIAVPVNDNIPVKKLFIAAYLSITTNSCIFLMPGENQSPLKKDNRCLLQSYQLLNDFGKHNIQCASSNLYDPLEGTLELSKHIHIDLIVINAGRESRLKGWWNKLRRKYLYNESVIPVLTVGLS